MPVIAIIDYHGVAWIETKSLLRKANKLYEEEHGCKPCEELSVNEAVDMFVGNAIAWTECPGKKLKVRKVK
jgi:hypothetical protein